MTAFIISHLEHADDLEIVEHGNEHEMHENTHDDRADEDVRVLRAVDVYFRAGAEESDAGNESRDE